VLRRRQRSEDPLAGVDPGAVAPRFAGAVADALATRRRYAALVAGMPDGPARDALAALAPRVDRGVLAVWETARRATEVERTVAALDPDRVTAEYKQARRSGADPTLVEALARRFESVHRLLNGLEDTAAQLQVLDARLSAVIAGAAEVALGATGGGADRLGAELDGVAAQLHALRGALDELG